MRFLNTPPKASAPGLNPAANLDPKALAERKKAEKVAEEFESVFLDMMLKSMRKTAVGEDESNAQSIYTGMLDSEYAKTMSANKSFGIKALILDWLEKNNHTKPIDKTPPGTEVKALSQPEPAEVQKQIKTMGLDAKRLDLENLNSKMATEIYSMQSRLLSK